MSHHEPISAGRYLISPITKPVGNGWYASSVAIRSGTGGSAYERVLRLTRLSQTRLAAASYATAEGLQWIGRRNPCDQGHALAAP